MIFLKIVLIVTVMNAAGQFKGTFRLSLPDVHTCALEMESYLNHAYPGYEEGDEIMAACKGTVPKHTEG